MKKSRKTICLIILLAVLILLFFLPPIMTADFVPKLGERVSSLEDTNAHFTEEIQESANRRAMYPLRSDHVCFINFRFWSGLEVEQVQQAEGEEPEVRRVLPFLYSASYEGEETYHCYAVTRGNSHWYFDLYTSKHDI